MMLQIQFEHFSGEINMDGRKFLLTQEEGEWNLKDIDNKFDSISTFRCGDALRAIEKACRIIKKNIINKLN